MKKLLLITLAIIAVSVFASAETTNDGAYPANKKGYNYKKHYRHQSFIKFCNRAFNKNGCKGHKFH